jgi:hypothetical protein
MRGRLGVVGRLSAGQDPPMSATRAPGPDPAPARAARLPPAVIVLAALLLLKAVSIAAVVLGVVAGVEVELLRQLAQSLVGGSIAAAFRTAPAASLLLAVTAVLLALAGIALLRQRRVGWLLAMVLTGVFVAVDIYAFQTTGANHAWMLLNIVTVFYLNQPEVRQVVGAASAPATRADAVPEPVP